MGLRGISFGSLLVILLIALLFFGSKRLSTLSKDVGTAIKNFRSGLKEADDDNDK